MKHDTRSAPLVRPDQLRPYPGNRPTSRPPSPPIIDGQARARELRRQNRLDGLAQLDQDARDIFG